jgi:hypothetical protein
MTDHQAYFWLYLVLGLLPVFLTIYYYFLEDHVWLFFSAIITGAFLTLAALERNELQKERNDA